MKKHGQISAKMAKFATDIADYLNLTKPDFSVFYETWCFISAYAHQLYLKKYQAYLKWRGRWTTKEFENILKSLEGVSGVYLLFSRGVLLYVGISCSLGKRGIISIARKTWGGEDIDSFAYYPTETYLDRDILERVLIAEHKPKLNIKGKSRVKPKLFDVPFDINTLERYDIYETVNAHALGFAR